MKTKTNPPIPFPTYEQTADRAKQLWEKNGQPEGRDVEFWLEAERQLCPPATTPSTAKTSVPSGTRRGSSSNSLSKVRDGDTIRAKTEELLDDTGEPGNRSATALNLGRS